MQRFLESVNSVVWGLPMLIFFMLTALRFTFKSKFFQISGFPVMLKATLGKIFIKSNSDGVSPFGAFCSVLGACIGTGNIVGVATAIYSGGAGTVFWMWVSALFSMMTAYAENYLGAEYRRKNKYGVFQGGAFSYMENGLQMKKLAKLYGVFCLSSSIGMGNLTQSNSVTNALCSGFSFNKYIVGFITAMLCYAVISGGMKRIAKFGTVAVPAMTAAYIILSSLVLIKHKQSIIPALEQIFIQAFSTKALGGFGIYNAMRYGIARGVFSNEAGLGSSTIIHDQAHNQSAETQGMWAMLEVFTDTVLLCTLTALTILVSTNTAQAELYGAELSVAAYSSIGVMGEKGISLLTAIFAFSSLTSCSFYGEKSLEYLFGKRHSRLYKIFYSVIAFLGSTHSPKMVWAFADICNGLMAVPNLFAVNCLGKEVQYPS